jgi:TonB family protein
MRFLFILLSALLYSNIAIAARINELPGDEIAPKTPIDSQDQVHAQPNNIPRILPSPPVAIAPPPPPIIHMPCGLQNFAPRPISLGNFARNPTYPQSAIAAGINFARLGVEISVNERGRVTNVVIFSSTAPGYFEQAAISDAFTMRFQPAMTDCRISSGTYRRTIRYDYRP